jgi:hypothetical protein
MKRVWTVSLAACAALGLVPLFTTLAAAQGPGQFRFGFRAAPELPAPDLNSNCIEDDGPSWPAGSDSLVAGAVVQGAYYCTHRAAQPGRYHWCAGLADELHRLGLRWRNRGRHRNTDRHRPR